MNEVIKNILYILITGVGLIIIKSLLDFINKKIDEIQSNIDINKYKKLNQYIDAAQNAISKAVLTVSQIYVDSLKSSERFDKASQEEAKKKAITIAKELITEESKEAIILLHGDFEAYLDVAIESLVKLNKTNS